MPHLSHRYQPAWSDPHAQPFASAAEAWFWYMACHQAKLDGARGVAGRGAIGRPCEPADIYRIVLRLYRSRRLRPQHLRVLVRYGRCMLAPDPHRPGRGDDLRHWREGLKRLGEALAEKGIVA